MAKRRSDEGEAAGQGDLFGATPEPAAPAEPAAKPRARRSKRSAETDVTPPPGGVVELAAAPRPVVRKDVPEATPLPSLPPRAPAAPRTPGRWDAPAQPPPAASRPTALEAMGLLGSAPPAAPTVALAPLPGAAPKAARAVLTVGELTRQIKNALETRFPRVIVRGEVSGFRGPNARGHFYFTLKDADASIDAKMWASQAARLRFALRDGLAVVAEGSVDLYEPSGRYSLIVQRLDPEGEGALALAFEQLKAKLAAEGLIGPGRTRAPRPLPALPRRIGVVTSRTGAALQDFLRVLHGRHPRLSVLLCDARVQGEGAAYEVARGIERLARAGVDVIVVTRGGGSVEDLWTFNEERVARAIWASPVPVVSAIGHEVDFTIADFVADWRAPTPSAAAERLAPVLADLEAGLATARARLQQAALRRLSEARERLGATGGRLVDPRRQLGRERLHLSELLERAMRVLRPSLRAERERLATLSERLDRRAPQAQLADQRARLVELEARLRAAVVRAVGARREALGRGALALQRATPAARVGAARTALQAQHARLLALQRRRLAEAGGHFAQLAARLDAMSPLKVMGRGYAVAFRADGRVVRGGTDVQVGDALTLRFNRGQARSLAGCEEVEATVTAKRGPVDC